MRVSRAALCQPLGTEAARGGARRRDIVRQRLSAAYPRRRGELRACLGLGADAAGSGQIGAPRPNWRKVTNEVLIRRIETGLIQPVIHRGTMTAMRRKIRAEG